jgi:3'-phosphoadenosine 5'-phosphosulfate sulfotransferase (PAPS reductase)/FAD synthetase
MGIMKGYDKYIVAFSGGKDSMACLLYLLDLGVPKHKIELWHHLIDGSPDEPTFMDWEVTEDYCRKVAEAFGVDIYFSWKEGGFKREMMRENSLTSPTVFETPNGLMKVGGTRGKKSTRLKFPQLSKDLKTRWCSAYLKIDICATAIRNQPRFDGIKTVVLSGERGEESPARGKYAILESDRSHSVGKRSNRHVDRWRPIRDWTEEEVWRIIASYGVVVHPCYYMGWSRCSCKFCIFGNADQFASAYEVSPSIAHQLIDVENGFEMTMKRDKDLETLILDGESYDGISIGLQLLATSKEYTGEIFTNTWTLPSGAYGESCGPS